MESMSKGMADVADRVKRSTCWKLPPLPVKTEFLGLCDGGCRCNIVLHTYEDGTQKQTGCKCEEFARLKAMQKGHKQRQFIKQSKIPYSKHQAKFEKYTVKDNKHQDLAKRVAMNYADKFDANYKAKADLRVVEKYAYDENISLEEANEKLGMNASEDADDIKTNLILMGTPGTGKTMLSSAIFYHVADLEYKCFFIESTTFIEMLKDSFQDKEKRYKLMRFIEDADLLIVDDIGTSFNSPWAVEQFKMLTDMRQGKFTIYTTNLTPNEFFNDTSLHRIYSRMNQNAYLLEMNFEDNRIKGS